MNAALVTTNLTLPGYEIEQNLGVCRGITVRSRFVVMNFVGMIQSLLGGDVSIYTTLCEQARLEAYQRMCSHARQIGADGIVTMRYDATVVGAGLTEVLCYGSAVKLRPLTLAQVQEE